MPPAEPSYTAENCRFAYQLLWSFNLFWRAAPVADDWLPPLSQAFEADGIRVLGHRFPQFQLSQFLLSTLPTVSPRLIAQHVKGRLQFFIRAHDGHAFQRNYSLRSIGSTTREKLEGYVAGQLTHHGIEEPVQRWRLDDLRVIRPDVDLSAPRFSVHAQYFYNLHVVVERAEQLPDFVEGELAALRTMLAKAAAKKRHLLSRAAFLPDHIHWLMGCDPAESPEQMALSYLNNLDHALGMRSAFRRSAYVATFGEYDVGAIQSPQPQSLPQPSGLPPELASGA